ncbi:uncharacterized protein LOC129583204 [Paramacrobiotus metropolitanus]|uniref:uncharacterized protein LOC129583204 n=1 Tax=Paramacrobiotus metropolitanus TaxID=2943436 RepID=UPI0024458F70|nr:uncharacterized protein LOC129583204 [Paramacrobiotus metropolitanus]
MEDVCVACTERLATIRFKPCNHRQYCSTCFPKVERRICPFNCPGSDVNETEDSTAVQLRPTTVADALHIHDSGDPFPYGCTAPNQSFHKASLADHRIVSAKIQELQAGRLTLAELERAADDLTKRQYNLLFIELFQDQDLHSVLKAADRFKFEAMNFKHKVKEMVVTTFTSPSYNAIAARSGLAAVADVFAEQIIDKIGGLGGTLNKPALTAIPNVAMFVIFSGVEIYRWKVSKSLSGKDCAKNVGEHFVGSLFGALGSYGGAIPGAAAGAWIGSVVPIIGTAIGGAIGAIIGAFLGGLGMDVTARLLYRQAVPRTKQEEKETEREEQRQMTADENKANKANKAAKKCNTDLQVDNFPEAQARFRRKLLDYHPDKHPDATAEQKEQLTAETRDLLACWQIVRQHYATKNASQLSDESFIRVCVLKVFEAATQQWKIVRTFFEDIAVGLDLNPDTERVENMVLYL